MYTTISEESDNSLNKKSVHDRKIQGNIQTNLSNEEFKNNPYTKNYTKKEDILDLNKHLEKRILVKFHGGREVTGILKGFDALLNLVLDDVAERLRDYEDWHLLDETRSLGLLVCRGTIVSFIAPVEGIKEIPNPFLKDSNKGSVRDDGNSSNIKEEK